VLRGNEIVSKWLSFAITSLMLVLALAACGGGDDDDADPTATTAAAASPSATSTTASVTGGSDAAATPKSSPTVESATPTSPAKGTAPSRPIATTPPTQPAATETPIETDAVSALEADMMDALLQPEDFTSDWTQDAFGPMEEDTDDSDELCGQPPFPDRDQKIAGVEASYKLDTAEPAFVVENIVIFPDDTAIDALAYARDMSSCGEWTDSDGQTYSVQPLDDPGYGDESFAASMAFESNGTPLYGEYTFIRVGGAIATVAFITLDGADVTPYQTLVGVSADRLVEADLDSGSSSAMTDLLLVADDIALVDSVNAWEDGDEIDSTDEERFALCGAGSFPDELGAVDEAGHELSANEDEGPYAMHSVVQMASGDGATAMEWIRSELSCTDWSDEDGEYVVSDSGDLDVGDDSYWLIVTITAADDSGQTVEVGYSFTQIGDYISVVGLAAQDSIDPELFGGIIALGAEKVSGGV
jgi:hypothetical protein